MIAAVKARKTYDGTATSQKRGLRSPVAQRSDKSKGEQSPVWPSANKDAEHRFKAEQIADIQSPNIHSRSSAIQ